MLVFVLPLVVTYTTDGLKVSGIAEKLGGPRRVHRTDTKSTLSGL